MKSAATSHPSASELRAFALSFPDVREEFPWGESAFKVNGKVFVFMRASAEGLGFSVKLPHSRDTALAQPFAEPTGYGLGKSGWVSSRFGPRERVPMDMVKRWFEESFRAIAPKRVLARIDGPASAPVTSRATKAPARKKVTSKSPRATESTTRGARKKR